MTLRRILFATTLIPFLSMSAVADEFTPGFDIGSSCWGYGECHLPTTRSAFTDPDYVAHDMQFVILRDTLKAGGIGAIGVKNFADDTANSIRGAVDDVYRTHTEVSCANGTTDASSCIIAIGYGALMNATTMNNTIAIGRCSGATLTSESRDLLIGDFTTAPRGKDGFVNLENKLCFWRDTGVVETCPPPNPECLPNQPKDTK